MQNGVQPPAGPGEAVEAAVLVQRLRTPAVGATAHPLRLPLTADQRASLRGHRRSACGRDLVLQLPRGEALQPGDMLLSADGQLQVLVEAAPEPVMRVRSAEPLALLQAAYHLGNRHVAMELHTDQLVLLKDSVLADLLHQRGLQVEFADAPFLPEAGAYAGHSHSHSHPHAHP
ncbi:MAG: urease accessory protein UreE [Vulcanococcus sp.]